jgi:hypothetical protein
VIRTKIYFLGHNVLEYISSYTASHIWIIMFIILRLIFIIYTPNESMITLQSDANIILKCNITAIQNLTEKANLVSRNWIWRHCLMRLNSIKRYNKWDVLQIKTILRVFPLRLRIKISFFDIVLERHFKSSTLDVNMRPLYS